MNPLPLNDAQQLVLQYAKVLGTEKISLLQSLGRVLAQEVRSNRDHPPYDVSAMDGYAAKASDLAVAGAQLKIVADIKAGDLPTLVLQAGECTRIMTGAPVPQGADVVIRVEDTQALEANVVKFSVSVEAGKDIRRRGENLFEGDLVLTAGTKITPGVLGILSMMKCGEIEVSRLPRVAILSSGDELEGLDDPFDRNKIPDANSYTLMAQVQALGIQPTLLGIARDTPKALKDKLVEGLQYDVLLISGGTSVGVHDFVRPTLEELGVQMHFWKMQMRPGHPTAFGTTNNCRVFCLPGNPVASMVGYEQLVGPTLRKMLGSKRLYRRTLPVRLAGPVSKRPGHIEFVRVTLSQDEQGYLATPTGTQSSGVLLSMARADALLIVPLMNTGMKVGDAGVVQLLDGADYQEHNGI